MLTAAGVRELIPHRYPMLLVDRVLELEPGERVVTAKAITTNEPWYSTLGENAGDRDLAYPGVLLIESFAQSAGVLGTTVGLGGDSASDQVTLIGAAADIRFGGRVFPGDRVEHTVRVVRTFDDSAIVEGESRAEGATVLTVGRMVLAFRRGDILSPAQQRTVTTDQGRRQ